MKFLSYTHKKGFTLIEFLVVIAIIGIMTAVLLPGLRNTDNAKRLDGAAEELILALREAQISATAVKEFKKGSDNFNVGYGVYFTLTDKRSYIFFGDLTNPINNSSTLNYNKKYNSSACPGSNSEECIAKIPLRNRITIDSFCVGTSSCTSTFSGTQALHVVFEKGKLGPTITVDSAGTAYGYAEIKLKNPEGATKRISIWKSGQMKIQ